MVTDDLTSGATRTNDGAPLDAADELRVRIDQDACTGDGLCAQLAPSVFELDVDGLAYVRGEDGDLRSEPGAAVRVPLPLVPLVIDAADDCPGDCIYVMRRDGSLEAGPGS
jgi:ferredoxin